MINPEARPIELPSTTPIATIQRVVAGSFGVPMEHMLSDRRDNAWPRQVAMYLSRELTSKSLPVIARCFRRDHTTVLYACRKVKRSVEKHPLIRADIDALKDALRPVDKVDNCPFSAIFEPLNAIEQTMKTQAESMAA